LDNVNQKLTIYTIGFSKKSLRRFIELLKKADVGRVVDVRLNNTSQLAGYSKRDDLEFVLSLVNIKYIHLPSLAPTENILKKYKDKQLSWHDYEKEFLSLLEERKVLKLWGSEINPTEINCLLCSEERPDRCHRRLVANYFLAFDNTVDVKHLY